MSLVRYALYFLEIELEITPRSQAVRTLEYDLLNQPIIVKVVSERHNKEN